MRIENWKKYFPMGSTLTQFSILVAAFSFFSIFNLIDFRKIDGNWWEYNNNPYFYLAIINYSISIAFFLLITFIHYKTSNDDTFSPAALFVTINVIFLILFPTTQIWIYLLVLFVTVVLDRTIRFKKALVFNSSAFGIFFGFLITYLLNYFNLAPSALFVSWWGAPFFKGSEYSLTYQLFIGIIFFLGFIYYSWKFEKAVFSVSFAFFYILIQYAFWYALTLDSVKSFYFAAEFLYANILFIASIMMIDLGISPKGKTDQLVFGIVNAVILFLFFVIRVNYDLRINGLLFDEVTDILGILTMNIVFFFTHRFIIQPDDHKV